MFSFSMFALESYALKNFPLNYFTIQGLRQVLKSGEDGRLQEFFPPFTFDSIKKLLNLILCP